GASRGWERCDADAERQRLAEHVPQIARADHLCGFALSRVCRPDVQVVAGFWRQKPAGERREEFIELDVLPSLDRLGDSKEIGKGAFQAPLVQIPRVTEQPKVDFTLISGKEQKPHVGNVFGRLLLLGFLRGALYAKHEVTTATIRDPDARIVVAPRLSEQ